MNESPAWPLHIMHIGSNHYKTHRLDSFHSEKPEPTREPAREHLEISSKAKQKIVRCGIRTHAHNSGLEISY